MEREVSQKMLGAGACIDVEKLRTMKSMGKLRVGGTKLVEGEGKVYGGSLRLVIELTLGGEGRAFLLRREHQHALQQIYIGNFISNHQWIKIIPYTQQKSIN